jgi:hypothetical protein
MKQKLAKEVRGREMTASRYTRIYLNAEWHGLLAIWTDVLLIDLLAGHVEY